MARLSSTILNKSRDKRVRLLKGNIIITTASEEGLKARHTEKFFSYNGKAIQNVDLG